MAALVDGTLQGEKIRRSLDLRSSGFFRFCVAMKWLDDNPVGTLKPPKVPPKPTLPFTAEEFEKVGAAVDRYPANNSYGHDNRARVRAFVLLLRYSGLRIRDVVCLRRDRIKTAS